MQISYIRKKVGSWKLGVGSWEREGNAQSSGHKAQGTGKCAELRAQSSGRDRMGTQSSEKLVKDIF